MKYIGTWCDIFLPSFDVSLSCMRAPLIAICVAQTYKMRGRSDCGLASVGNFCMYSFSASKASCCSSPHSKVLEPLSTLKNGKLHSANFAMNRFNAAMLPVSFCTSFLDLGGFI
jgi:hypothetical protein